MSSINFSLQVDISPANTTLITYQPKSTQSFRYGHNSEPVGKRYALRTPSETSRYFNSAVFSTSGIERFLVKLYFAKTQDLQIQPNQKQQRIFVSRLQRTIN